MRKTKGGWIHIKVGKDAEEGCSGSTHITLLLCNICKQIRYKI